MINPRFALGRHLITTVACAALTLGLVASVHAQSHRAPTGSAATEVKGLVTVSAAWMRPTVQGQMASGGF